MSQFYNAELYKMELTEIPDLSDQNPVQTNIM